jgi:hypothetical protein
MLNLTDELKRVLDDYVTRKVAEQLNEMQQTEEYELYLQLKEKYETIWRD